MASWRQSSEPGSYTHLIGLGYVGLPLARLFSTKYPTVGFDMNADRVKALMVFPFEPLQVDILDKLRKRGFPHRLPVVIYLAELVGIQTQFRGHLHLPV